jgi:hypothetical protein
MTGEAAAAVRAGHRGVPEGPFAPVLARAAWFAIFLGLSVQILVLVAKIAVGGQSTRLQLIVDVASGVIWSAPATRLPVIPVPAFAAAPRSGTSDSDSIVGQSR